MRTKKLPPQFTELMVKIHSCPASSASIERWFSTIGFVWSKERNRLGEERAMKLAQVYRSLRFEVEVKEREEELENITVD